MLRGLHYQIQQPESKLVRVVRGAVFGVAVDFCKGSPTFGKRDGMKLSEDNHKQLWTPARFANGFQVTSDSVEFLYKTTGCYAPEHERCIACNDAAIGIDWPVIATQSSLSAKDEQGQALLEAETF